jgi:hypothetical protein
VRQPVLVVLPAAAAQLLTSGDVISVAGALGETDRLQASSLGLLSSAARRAGSRTERRRIEGASRHPGSSAAISPHGKA